MWNWQTQSITRYCM